MKGTLTDPIVLNLDEVNITKVYSLHGVLFQGCWVNAANKWIHVDKILELRTTPSQVGIVSCILEDDNNPIEYAVPVASIKRAKEVASWIRHLSSQYSMQPPVTTTYQLKAAGK